MMISIPQQPVRRRKIYEEIAERIESMMLAGDLKPGDAMPSERELMETFQVGRTSVREALFALQRMGLIAVRNGERAYVTRPSAQRLMGELSGTVRHMVATEEGMREFQQARLFLECSLARHAALQASEEDIDSIGAALEANRNALGDAEVFGATDVAFHFAIIAVARNSIVEVLHSAMFEWLAEQRTIGLRQPNADLFAYEGHKAIYAAISNHDADQAEQAMASHLAAVAANYWASAER